MKTTVLFEVFVDLVLDDVMNDGSLFEMNPYHGEGGKFASQDAAAAYQSGAMARGRAAGMKAKAQGQGREQIRAAIKDAMQKHVETGGDRAAGQARLDLIRGKIEKGTLPGQKGGAPKVKPAEKLAPTTYGDLRKVAPALGVADQAYVHGLVKPETDAWKAMAKAGNIDRTLEQHAAGQLNLPAATVAALKQAKAELTKQAAPEKPAAPEIQRLGDFLAGWANGKTIVKVPGTRTLYKAGKWATKVEPGDLESLLNAKIAQGNVNAFTVPKQSGRARDVEGDRILKNAKAAQKLSKLINGK